MGASAKDPGELDVSAKDAGDGTDSLVNDDSLRQDAADAADIPPSSRDILDDADSSDALDQEETPLLQEETPFLVSYGTAAYSDVSAPIDASRAVSNAAPRYESEALTRVGSVSDLARLVPDHDDGGPDSDGPTRVGTLEEIMRMNAGARASATSLPPSSSFDRETEVGENDVELISVRSPSVLPAVPFGAPTSKPPSSKARRLLEEEDDDTTRNPDASPWDAHVGHVVDGRYRLVALIAAGGMGAVFEAEHTDIGKRVAVKLLRALGALRHEARARFLREARAASAVDSDNVVQVYDAGEDPQLGLYMVMELLKGLDLARYIDLHGKLAPAEAAGVAIQACHALERAHGAGIVHRDLKPANVFLVRCDDGSTRVKLVDFGLAKLVREAQGWTGTQITRGGSAIGTPQYMSPEQAQGLDTIDHRTDVYSLGASLFEALTGDAPYELLPSYEMTILQIILQPRPRVSSLLPETPERLDELVAKMMARDPSARPQSVADVKRRLLEIFPELEARHLVLADIPTGTGFTPAEAPTVILSGHSSATTVEVTAAEITPVGVESGIRRAPSAPSGDELSAPSTPRTSRPSAPSAPTRPSATSTPPPSSRSSTPPPSARAAAVTVTTSAPRLTSVTASPTVPMWMLIAVALVSGVLVVLIFRSATSTGPTETSPARTPVASAASAVTDPSIGPVVITSATPTPAATDDVEPPASAAAIRDPAPSTDPTVEPPATHPAAQVPAARAPVVTSAPTPPVEPAPKPVAPAVVAAPAAKSTGGSLTKQAQRALADGSADEAVRLAKKATDRNPEDEDAWLVLGSAYEQLGNALAARGAYGNCAMHPAATRCAAKLR